MDLTSEQRDAFQRALSEAMDARGLKAPGLAAALEAKGHKASHQKIYQWLSGKGAPRTIAMARAVDEVLNADGRIVAALYGDVLAQRVAVLEERWDTTDRMLAEVRTALTKIERLVTGR